MTKWVVEGLVDSETRVLFESLSETMAQMAFDLFAYGLDAVTMYEEPMTCH